MHEYKETSDGGAFVCLEHKYCICSKKSWAQIEAAAQIETGCQLTISLIEAGFEYTPVLLQCNERSFPLRGTIFGYECHDRLSTIKRRLAAFVKEKAIQIKFKFKLIVYDSER